MKKRVLIAGGGGFIGGHLSNFYYKKGYKVYCVDIKKKNHWFQINPNINNLVADCRDPIVCDKITKNIDYVFNLACNMGGMGFIENNKALCMLSAVININLLNSSKKNKIKKYFYSSSACIYPSFKQKNYKKPKLKEEDAYPADPEDGYGWEKLFNERMCRHFYEDFGLETRIARYHNIYGTEGTWEGGREKAPAALTRKIIEAIKSNKKFIEIWGNGNQVRSFLHIQDCIEATDLLFRSKFRNPINIGHEKHVSINKLVNIIENISGQSFKKKYNLKKPQGVFSRSSDNTLIKNTLKWSPKIKLEDGMKELFNFISKEFNKKYGSDYR